MAVMLERWNDDKMDALDGKVDALDRRIEKSFEKVDTELREQRREMNEQRTEIMVELREQRQETKVGLERLDNRIDRLYQALIGAAAVIAAAIVTAPYL